MILNNIINNEKFMNKNTNNSSLKKSLFYKTIFLFSTFLASTLISWLFWLERYLNLNILHNLNSNYLFLLTPLLSLFFFLIFCSSSKLRKYLFNLLEFKYIKKIFNLMFKNVNFESNLIIVAMVIFSMLIEPQRHNHSDLAFFIICISFFKHFFFIPSLLYYKLLRSSVYQTFYQDSSNKLLFSPSFFPNMNSNFIGQLPDFPMAPTPIADQKQGLIIFGASAAGASYLKGAANHKQSLEIIDKADACEGIIKKSAFHIINQVDDLEHSNKFLILSQQQQQELIDKKNLLNAQVKEVHNKVEDVHDLSIEMESTSYIKEGALYYKFHFFGGHRSILVKQSIILGDLEDLKDDVTEDTAIFLRKNQDILDQPASSDEVVISSIFENNILDIVNFFF